MGLSLRDFAGAAFGNPFLIDVIGEDFYSVIANACSAPELVAFFLGEVAAAGGAARVKDDFTILFDLPGIGQRVLTRCFHVCSDSERMGWNGKGLFECTTADLVDDQSAGRRLIE
jgi:hypothetical protein